MNIQDILSPYADDQPNVEVKSNIQRMPPLAVRGVINTEFQKFFNRVANAFQTDALDEYHIANVLFENSNNCATITDMQCLVGDTWHNVITAYNTACPACRGADIEINLDRFHQLHRNIVGSLNVMLFYVDSQSMYKIYSSKLHQVSTELFYTYKDNKFYLLPTITPFVEEQE